MKCPVCDVQLKHYETSNLTADVCPKCDGIFYPKDQFQKHLNAVKKSLTEEVPLRELISRKVTTQYQHKRKEKNCPACNEIMTSFNYAYDSNIFVDRCPECSSIWTDGGTIVHIARYIRGSPKLDSIVRGFAEHEQEKQKLKDRAYASRHTGRRFFPVPFFFLLPLSDTEERRTIPLVTISLIVLNVIFFIISLMHPFGILDVLYEYGAIPEDILKGQSLHTLLTYQFLHGDILHLLSNMLFLWIFGDNVEDRFGKARFLFFYLLFGIVAGLIHVLANPNSDVPCIGASGAIAGVMGAYLVFYPTAIIRTVVFYFIVPIPAIVYLFTYFVIQVLFSVTASNIAYYAHIGGFIVGVVFAIIFTIIRRRST